MAKIEKLRRQTVAEMRQNHTALTALRGHPFGFLFHYIRRHKIGHAIVLGSVLLAVGCSVASQYGMKQLVDVVSHGPDQAGNAVWFAFGLLCILVTADNMLWRVGGYAAARTYVSVTGDIRADLFAYLSSHSPHYFAERLPGALAGRVSAAANAAFTLENTGSWNVLPPCVAVVCAIALIGSVNPLLAATLVGFAAALGALVFWLARRGTPLHRSYAEKAAAVDGELVDVVGNFHVVRAFGATFREQRRIGRTIGREMGARRHSLFYMEYLRLIHAALTVVASAGVIAWGILLWQAGRATVGDIGTDHQSGRLHPALHARPRRRAGRSDPARRPAGGGNRNVADPA